MSNFRRRTIHAAPQLSIENNTAADAGSQRYTDDGAIASAGTLPHLTDGGSIRIVLQNCRPLKFALQGSRKSKTVQGKEHLAL